MLPQHQAVLFGILFTICAWAIVQTFEIFKLDRKLIRADQRDASKARRIVSLTAERDDRDGQIEALAAALREANERAEDSERRAATFEAHGRHLFSRAMRAQKERDDALGKLGALGQMVRSDRLGLN